MKYLIPLLFFVFSVRVQSIRFCCSGSLGGTTPPTATSVQFQECPINQNTKCYTTTTVGITAYFCGDDSGCSMAGTTCCSTEACNCPANVHKTTPQIQEIGSEMRSIMYPLLGMLVALVWIVAAVFMPSLPLKVVLLVFATLDCIFGIFLVFLPVSAYVGLFFTGIGAFTIAVAMHGQGNRVGLYSICILSLLGFFVLGGFVNIVSGNPLYETVYSSIGNCENSMNIQNLDVSYFNVNTRCENWLLFILFDIFVLFLIQPLIMMAAFFTVSGGGSSGGSSGGSGKKQGKRPTSGQPRQGQPRQG